MAATDLASDSQESAGLWPGDAGTLPLAVRKVLVALLRGPYLSPDIDRQSWEVLMANLPVVRSRLADVCAELALDTDQEVAFARNVKVLELDLPKLMRSQALNFLDTALLLYLRRLLLRAASTGERAFVGRDDIDQAMDSFRSHDNTDRATFRSHVNASINRLKGFKVLESVEDSDRFRISPVLALQMSAEDVAELEAEYRKIAEESGPGAGPDSGRDCGPDLVDRVVEAGREVSSDLPLNQGEA